MKVMEYHSLNDEYPSGVTNSVFPGGIKNATGINNLYYCVIPSGANARFSIAAKSNSGTAIACMPTAESGYALQYGYASSGTWFACTNG